MSHAYTYAMAVGKQGADRLNLLDRAYGPGTRRVLLDAGLRAGMRVADLGCGTGFVARFIAEQVGPNGSVVGVDSSAEQIEKAREHTRAAGLKNLNYLQASISQTGLRREHFDLIYCRDTLKHLSRPEDAVAEMRELLRPGGALVCEEAALDTSACEPPSEAHRRLQTLSWTMLERVGCDWKVARRLYHLVRAMAFKHPIVSYYQPAFVRGQEKRFEELSFRAIADRIVASGVAAADEVTEIADAVQKLAEDDGVVYSLSRMTQVWARK